MNTRPFRIMLFVILSIVNITSNAQTFKVNGVYYSIYSSTHSSNVVNGVETETFEGKAQVTNGNDKYKGNITILEKVDYEGRTYVVDKIGSYSFSNCWELLSVNMPNTLVEIETSAFYGCSKLESIDLPSSLQKIGQSAFSSCSIIKKMVIPSSVSEIGNQIFSGCDALESIVVEEGNSRYNSGNNSNAIIDATTNTLVAGCGFTQNIPESVVAIGDYAFNNNHGVKSLAIPNTIKTIGDYAFSNCSSLSSIVLSSSLVEIGTSAFYGCSKIKYIEFPSTLQKMGGNAFASCTGLVEIISYIENPFEISEDVFYDYNNKIYNKTFLYVPVAQVNSYRNTKGWKNFVNINKIEEDPSLQIDGLIYTIKKRLGYAILSKAESDIIYAEICSNVTYDGIEYLVTEIGDAAFASLSSLVFVRIPNNITTIGQDIFANCDHLAAIDWQIGFKPSPEFISNLQNPNLLFYISSPEVKPDGIRNIIVNGVAESIILTDDEKGDFYCPIEFTAQNISYTHKYGLKTEPGICQGWESIALPFDVQVYMTDKGEAKPFAIAKAGERMFWLRELSASGFVESDGIKANVPYIISMPNWEGYQDFYNIVGEVVFSAQNCQIKQTMKTPVEIGNRQFWPNYTNASNVTNIAILYKDYIHPSNTNETILPGSAFLSFSSGVKIMPFEAFFYYEGASTRAILISELMAETTGIDECHNKNRIYSQKDALIIDSSVDFTAKIYSVNGQLSKIVKIVKGHNVVTGLNMGIYIVNNKKIVIQ